MDGLDNQVVPTGAEPVVQVPDAVPQIDRAEYEALKQYYTDTQPFVEKVRPHYDQVVKFVDNEQYRNLADQAYQSYETINKQQEEQVPKWAQEVLKSSKESSEFVAETRAQMAVQAAGKRLMALPGAEILADNVEMYQTLEKQAKAIGLTTLDQFEKYVAQVLPYMGTAKTAETTETHAPKTPPRSLRGDTSLPGTRAPSIPSFSQGRKGIQERKAYIRSEMNKTAASGGR